MSLLMPPQPQPLDVVYGRIGLGPFHFFSLLAVGCYFVTESLMNFYIYVIAKAAESQWSLSDSQFFSLLVARDCGVILTGVPLPWLGDKYGRLTVMRWGLIGRFLASMLAVSALSYRWLVAGLFLSGCFLGFNRPAVSSFAIEIMPVRLRGAILIGLFVFILSGALGSAALTIYLLPTEKEDSWRTLLLICSLPMFLGLIGAYLLFVESPRYLAMVGKPLRAVRYINKMAKCNLKSQLTPEEIAIVCSQPVREHFSLREATQRLLSPHYRPRLWFAMWFWFITGYQYAACMSSFPHNLEPYTSNPLMPLEIAALANAVFIPMPTVEMPAIGRKGTLKGFVVLQAVFCFSAILMDNHFAFAIAVIPYVVALTLSLRVLFPFTLELFETSIRCYSFGLCFAAARFGAILSKLQDVHMHENSVVILLVFNFIGLIVLDRSPYETAGQPLVDYTGKV